MTILPNGFVINYSIIETCIFPSFDVISFTRVYLSCQENNSFRQEKALSCKGMRESLDDA